MAVTTIPYLIGYASQGDEWQFTGFVFGVTDGNSYIAKMLSGANGDWLFRTPYTPYPQQGVLAFLPYLLLGKISAPPGQHLQLVSLFHIFRYSAGVLAILATYDFLSIFLKSTSVRRWGLAIAILGGGLGWVLVLIGRASVQGSLPLDFYSPESFGFLAIYELRICRSPGHLCYGHFVFYCRACHMRALPALSLVLIKSAISLPGWFSGIRLRIGGGRFWQG